MLDSQPPDHPFYDPEQSPFERSVPPLSPSERKVCALLLQRMTERAIAEHLERSPNTIHVHVRNIYRKLGVCTRKQLLEYPGIIQMIVRNDD
ncbi:MAG: helix-turn-helix transcriptional regulator [Planctomycetota bacterium]